LEVSLSEFQKNACKEQSVSGLSIGTVRWRRRVFKL